jgi:hypothetical protein
LNDYRQQWTMPVASMERLQQIYIRLIAGASLDELRYLCTEL